MNKENSLSRASQDKNASWSQSNLGNRYGQGAKRFFPAEYLLRAMTSDKYFATPTDLSENARVLEIGCFALNNVLPFADRGCQLFGIEINEEMIDVARHSAEIQGLECEIRKGMNDQIPWDDGFFDILLSLNTIHYQDSAVGVDAAIAEYARVLAPGGQALISTPGQCHSFYETATRLGHRQYQLNRPDDFRNGQIMSYFDDKQDFQDGLGEAFSRVEIATITEEYPEITIQFMVAKCMK